MSWSPPVAGDFFCFSDPSGLSAEAEFTLLSPTLLEVRVRNTSTDVPEGFDYSDQVLTGVSWDFGLRGDRSSDTEITGGVAIIGPSSHTLDFDTGDYGPDYDVSGEYGYGNRNGTGLMQNFITTSESHGIGFGGPNLDGPEGLDGPQGGLVADPLIVRDRIFGVIQDEAIVTVTLDPEVEDLEFLYTHGIRIEFGSDAFWLDWPESPSGTSETSWGAVKSLYR